jgi:hypothetical protein
MGSWGHQQSARPSHHRHPSLEQILKSLSVDRESANHGSGECQPIPVHEWTPPTGEAGEHNDTHQSESHVLADSSFVVMAIVVVAVMIVIMIVLLVTRMTMVGNALRDLRTRIYTRSLHGLPSERDKTRMT